MAMSKKHYEALALAVREAYIAQEYCSRDAEYAVALVAQNIAQVCYADNHNFNKTTFYSACIPKEHET